MKASIKTQKLTDQLNDIMDKHNMSLDTRNKLWKTTGIFLNAIWTEQENIAKQKHEEIGNILFDVGFDSKGAVAMFKKLVKLAYAYVRDNR
jgi:hypothetical protein